MNLELFWNLILVGAGLAMLFFGAEWLVKGSVTIANKLRMSQLVIGLTIVAFGTSTPELAVSISSATKGISDVALGNVVGSNIANIGLILGLSAFIAPIAVSRKTLRKEVPLMIGISFLLLAVSIDGSISFYDGILFVGGILIFTIFSYKTTRKEVVENVISNEKNDSSFSKSIILIIIGLILLTVGAFFTVDNAVIIAKEIGLSERIIGLTLVAVGTSLPELITSIVAAKRGHTDISVGNILGSNIFNILAILGISSSITAISVNDSMWTDYVFMILFAVILLPIIKTGLKIGKIEGMLLVAGYVGYTAFLIFSR
ncbi:MAG: calcium/sodium antiporter [Nitrosopumilus sp.]